MKTMKIEIAKEKPVFSPEKQEYISGIHEVPRTTYWIRRERDNEFKVLDSKKSEKKS